jgi:hypothetical protein
MTPGIKHLAKALKEKSNRVSLREVNENNLRFGVDMSITLVKALSTGDASEEFWQLPMVPVMSIIPHLDKLKNTLDGADMPFIAVFDGCRHPMKSKTTEKRNAEFTKKRDRLDQLIAAGDPQSYSEIQRLRRGTTYIREDVIALARDWCGDNDIPFVCAPFEADWQLALMCSQGILQGVISDDSDMVVLGCPKVIMNIDFSDKTCIIIKHDSILISLAEQFGLVQFTHDDLLAYAAFLGNDYLDNVKNNGFIAVNELMRQWCRLSAVEKNAFLIKYEETKMWNPSSGGGRCTGYVDMFKRCTNIWKYAVGWKITSVDGESILETFKKGNFCIELGSFHPSPEGDLRLLLGFEPTDVFSAMNIDGRPHMDFYNLKYYARTGAIVEALPISTEPPGAHMDTNIPLCCQSMHALVLWLSARRIPCRQHDTREDLMKVVQDIFDFQDRTGMVDIPPIVPLPTDGVGKYVSWETLTTDTVIDWKGGDAMWAIIRESFPSMNDRLVTETFGRKQPALRLKSKRYIRSGHYDYETMRVGNAMLKIGDVDNNPVMILKIDCCASLRSDVYEVLLVFNSADRSFQSFPVSRCSCKNGRVFCSHMLGLMFVISIIQSIKPGPGCNFDTFVSTMPTVICNLRSLIILLEYAITKHTQTVAMCE